MGEGITLAGSSNAVESPTRERPGAFGATLSNNEASNVVHLDESRQESPGLVYTRSSFSGDSSSCGYNESKSNSQEVAPQTSEYTDPCIRSITSSKTNPESDLQISRVSQNRIDFEEVATPLDKIDNIKDKLLVMTDVLRTLRLVHLTGRVHRNISMENIYFYKDPITQEKKGMIGNFEYAEEVGVVSQNGVRTGTPDFMAIEIARQLYLFAKLSTNTGESKGPDYYIRRQMDKEKNPGLDDTPEGFYYNYIHDLESVWWIAVWALFNFEKKDIGANKFDSWAAGQRKVNKRKLFIE